MPVPQYDFNVDLNDLAFILKQIKIAEASTDPLTGQIIADPADPNSLPNQVGSSLLPYGLRTVDGTWNSLLPGMERLGAADNIMPRLVAARLNPAEAPPPGFPGTPGVPTSYAQTAPGNIVYDSQPRIISNLIVDQTAGNFAAVIAAQDRADIASFPGFEEVQVSSEGTLFIPNQSPDIGLSPPFNGAMTIFGQFFDHGLDLITKGGGTVFVPLQRDDPLYVEGSNTNFMVLSRAANTRTPGADGELGNEDDTWVADHQNTTTPFVDQNQTYTSHPSHQVFLREYTMVATGTDLRPVDTGRLLSGEFGEGNWGDVKAQAAEKLGILLTDEDVFNVPLLATDRYGNFLRGPNGFAQIVTLDGLVEGNPAAPISTADAIRTNHEFLIDVAHHAVPFADLDRNPATEPSFLAADADEVAGPADTLAGTYDNELLDRHFATGDGRGNENIALTAIHSVFHSEHNRLVEAYKTTLLGSNDLAVLNEWLATPVTQIPTDPADIAALQWNGARLFQAGRFATEMQYQHLVFEEFARGVSPAIDPFIFSNSADIDPAIFAEFANVVYRFGHSMLTEDVARLGPNLENTDIGLIQAFLNPVEFNAGGATEAEAIGQIMRGMTRQVGNEIDEFVTDALRNQLLGLPLDLAVLNITRARETGAPSFNEARASFHEMTGDSQYLPYTSWADLAPNLKNPASIVNFIAAYGQHESITSATTVEAKRAAAMDLVIGTPGETAQQRAERMEFLHGDAATTGVNNVDFWVGGLAEAKTEFGGMLGPTFNFVFESQMENLQNGDRFYYLSRTQGLNMLNELEANSFSKMVMRNSDLGGTLDENGVLVPTTTHLPSLLFATPSYTLEMDQENQLTGIVGPDGTTLNGDPVRDNAFLNAFNPLVVRARADTDGDGLDDTYNFRLDRDGDGEMEYDGFLRFGPESGEHVVLGGTAGRDILISGRGLDALWGDGGDDYLDGGDGPDNVHGGDGDDIIVDHGTEPGAADFLRGDNGNDVISAGAGNDLLFGGAGNDFLMTGNDFSEVFSGHGDDFVLGGNGPDVLMGNEGNDWIEGGEGFDGLSGENSELFFNSAIVGHDVLNGQGNDTDYDGESGDDIMVQTVGIERSNGMFGFDWAIHKGDPVDADSDLGIPFFPAQTEFILRDRFDSVEALSGWNGNDVLTGTRVLRGGPNDVGGTAVDNPLDHSDLIAGNVGLIEGLAELLGTTDAEIDARAVIDPNDVVIDVGAGAEVIIGGGGNDSIRGNIGNDILDGDAWLNVRIEVAGTGDVETFSVDSLNEIRARMVTGEINPGRLSIVREILQSTTAATDIDVAVYNEARANYIVEARPDGGFTVSHDTIEGLINDGIDVIRNFERIQFADEVVELGNAPPVIVSNGGGATGTASVAENTLLVTTVLADDVNVNVLGGFIIPGQVLTFSIAGGADASRFVIDTAAGALSFATGPNYEAPADADADNIYEVIVGVSDGTLIDTQALAVTVTNVNEAATGAVRIAGYTATDTAATLTAASTLADEDFGAGLDTTFQWQQLAADGVTWNDIAGATGATLADRSGATVRVVTSYTDVGGLNTVASLERAVIGTVGNNSLTGSADADFVLGLGGADTLIGGAGNDTVDGGSGNDLMRAGAADGNDSLIGGTGSDTYNLAATTSAATVNLTTGSSTSAQTGLDSLAGIENVTGSSGGDTITDSGVANVLTGGGGQDTFIMLGDNVRDTVNGVGAGNAIDYSSATTALTVTLTNGAVVNGSGTTAATSDVLSNVDNFTGGSGNDSITGNADGNRILGGGGNDTLAGGTGADLMDGGVGNDLLLASAGADTLIGGDGVDTYSLAATNAAAQVNLAAGTSSSAQTGNDSLATIENVIGSQGGDTIRDSAVANVLTGGGGADTFIMSSDNLRDTVDGAGGSNSVDYSASTTGLSVTLGAGAVVTGSGTTAGTSDVISSIDNFVGGSGSDSVTGNANANRLTGNGGADTLSGLGGADTLLGSAGNDALLGGDGADSLDGGADADTLTGGLGSDTSIGGTGIDVFDFNSIAEIPNEAPALRDQVADFVSGTDKLDFNSIDANANLAGNQDFTFSTTSGDGFTADAQLRYHSEAPGSLMQGNVGLANGLVTDMQVALVGVTTLVAADVIV